MDLPVRLGSNNDGEVEGQLANLSMAACSYLSSNAGLSRGLCADECIAGIL